MSLFMDKSICLEIETLMILIMLTKFKQGRKKTKTYLVFHINKLQPCLQKTSWDAV